MERKVKKAFGSISKKFNRFPFLLRVTIIIYLVLLLVLVFGRSNKIFYSEPVEVPKFSIGYEETIGPSLVIKDEWGLMKLKYDSIDKKPINLVTTRPGEKGEEIVYFFIDPNDGANLKTFKVEHGVYTIIGCDLGGANRCIEVNRTSIPIDENTASDPIELNIKEKEVGIDKLMNQHPKLSFILLTAIFGGLIFLEFKYVF